MRPGFCHAAPRIRQPEFWAFFNSSTGARGSGSETFTRATAQWAFLNDTLTEYASGVPAFGDNGLAGTPTRANRVLYSRDFTNAAWVKTNITALKDATGITAVANSASTLTAGAGNGTVFQTVTLGSLERTTSFYVRRKTGTGTIEMTDDGGAGYTDITSSINASTYTKVTLTNTQANPSVGFRIVTSGDEIEVDWSGIEDGAFSVTLLPTTSSAATVNATNLSYLISGNIPVNDFVLSFEWTPRAEDQAVPYLFGSFVDANSSIGILHNGTNLKVRKILSGTAYDADIALSYTEGTIYKIKARYSSTNGVDVWLDNVKGTNDSNTTDCVLNTSFFIGSSGVSTGYQYGEIKNFKVYQGDRTDAQVVAL